YYSTAVNRCARLRAIGHGGQTLLSQATCELVRDTLPPDVSLQDMGRHRLKDLQRPEQVFQLLHPELPATFPPLKSLDAFSHNLPRQLTTLIGREQEIAAVKRLLGWRRESDGHESRVEQEASRTHDAPTHDARLVTLTGPGGTGKTRLGLQAAAKV